QAALGLSQMARIEEFISCRQELGARYDSGLVRLPLTRQKRAASNRSALHLYVVCLAEGLETEHRRIFEQLRAAGIGVNLHYMPVYLQPYYRALGFSPGLCPEAERYYKRAISLRM